MKLLIATPVLDSNIGGMERFVIEFSTTLSKQGHLVTILTGKGRKDLELEDVKTIRSRIFFLKPFNKLAKYLQLSYIARRHLAKNKYDAVLAMGPSGLFLNDYIWRASGSPVPVMREQRRTAKMGLLSRTLVSLDLSTQEWMERKCVRKARIHMFPSMQMKALYEKTYGFESKKYFIPCSGAGNMSGSGGSPGADSVKKIPAKGIRVLTVGGLSEERKGSKAIIEAMSSPGLEDAWLIVAGKIAVDVKEPLKSRTVPLGSVDFREMPVLYQNCDLLIFPSIYEGFPNVLLEAAYYGLPMISSRLEGVEEYFRDGKDILLVEKNDPKGLADRIKTLSASPEMREKLSTNAKSRAEAIEYGIFVREFVSFISSKDGYKKNLLSPGLE